MQIASHVLILLVQASQLTAVTVVSADTTDYGSTLIVHWNASSWS